MKLYSSPTSPFARKVIITAALCGLENKITLVNTDVYSPSPEYKMINPLIKLPALEMQDGKTLVNSAFICEYLNSISEKYKVLPSTSARWSILNDQAIADGGLDAAVLRRYESLRAPEHFDSKFDLRQKDKILNTLEYFERRTDFFAKNWSLCEITVACLAGYLNFRFANEKLQNQFPKVFQWHDQSLKQFEFMKKTVPG